MNRNLVATVGIATLAIAGLAAPAPAEAQYRQKITNDAAKCAAGAGPAASPGRAPSEVKLQDGSSESPLLFPTRC